MYLTRPIRFKQDVTQGQYLRGLGLVWIQSDPSARLIDLQRLTNEQNMQDTDEVIGMNLSATFFYELLLMEATKLANHQGHVI